MGNTIEENIEEAAAAIKKIRGSGGKLQGNFYYAGTGKGGAALVVTLLARDKQGQKALTAGKKMRKLVKGAKFARGTVTMDGGKLLFTQHSGSASLNHLKQDFKKDLGTKDGMRALRSALLKKFDQQTAEVVDPDEAPDTTAPTLTEAEAAEVETLKGEQNKIADLNGQLAEFLSEADAQQEHAEQIAEQMTAVNKALRKSPRDDEAVRQARAELASVMAIGDDPFPQEGQQLSSAITNILALSLERLAQPSKEAAQAEETQSDEPGEYQSLLQQVEAQLSVLTALYGARNQRCQQINKGLIAAQQAVLTGPAPPYYDKGITHLKKLLAKSALLVSEGRQQYAQQREREADLEARRLEALNKKLLRESQIRLLKGRIDALKKRMGKEFENRLDSINALITTATAQHGNATDQVAADNITAVTKGLSLSTGGDVLNDFATALTALDAVLKSGNDAIAEANAQYTKLEGQTATSSLRPKASAEDRNPKSVQELMAQHKTLLAQVNGEVLLPPEQLADFLEQLNMARTFLMCSVATNDNTSPIVAAKVKLKWVKDKFDRFQSTTGEAYRDSIANADRAEAELVKLVAIVRPRDALPWQTKLQTIRQLIESGSFATADQNATAFQSDIATAIGVATAEQGKWDAIDLKGIEKQLQDQVDADIADVPHPPKELTAQYHITTGLIVQRSITHQAGVAQMEQLKTKIAENNRFLKEKLGVGQDLEAGIAQITACQRAVTEALATLEAGLREEPREVVAQFLDPHKQALQTLNEQWKAQTLSTPADTSVVATYKAQYDALQATVASAGTGQQRTDQLKAAVLAAANTKLETIRKSIHTKHDRLQELGVTGGGAKKREVDTRCSTASQTDDPEQINALVTELEDKSAKLTEQITEKEASSTELQRQTKAALTAATAKFAAYEKYVNDHNSGILGFLRKTGINDKHEYKAYVDTLRAELDEMKTVAGSTFPGLLEAVKKDLENFTKDVDGAIKGLRDILVEDADTHEKHKTSISQLKHEIEAEKRALPSDLATWMAAKHKEHTTDLDALYALLGKEVLDLSRRKFTKLQAEIRLNDAQVKKDIKRAADLEKRATQYERTINTSPISDFPIIQQTLTAKLTAARAQMTTSDALNHAEVALDDIKTSIDKTDNGGDLAAMVRDIDANNSVAAQQKVEWDGELAAFRREFFDPFQAENAAQGLERLLRLVKDHPKIKEIKKLLSMATDAAEKTDYQMARYQLSLARGRIAYHQRFPDGPNAALIKDLKQLPQRWRQTIQGFQVAIDKTIIGINQALEAAQHTAGVTELGTSAATIKSLLRADAFDSIVAQYDNADEAKKRALREAALGEIRELNAVLRDPLIVMLTEHPFTAAPKFTGHFEVGKALLDLERSFLLSANSNA